MLRKSANSVPNARVIPNQISRQGTTRCKKSSSTLVVAVRVDRWHVFDLLKSVHFLLGELQEIHIKLMNRIKTGI